MRKNVKKEILQILNMLQGASGKIKTVLQAGNPQDLRQFLADCQDTAIGAGNLIEQSEGEGTEAVAALERYCELLYRVLETGQADEGRLQESVKEAIDGVEALPVKKEVLFLPYNASMWDSLESVWMAARDDENCDTYVMPIPYFDKNPDGSLGQMHYEGSKYPDFVPITDWRRYDIAERKPDVIYIHNPYDNWNYATSVHPNFYAEKLKDDTEELVYIPYFVLPEIKPDDEKAIEGMKHFCFLPGTVYADKVIVQSENMRQIYINEFRKAAMENGLPEEYTDRTYLEKKFLGLGSPKLDKVANRKKEDIKIPQEWQQYICKQDGSKKKIILYNNSITALLKNNEKMLEKMERVLTVFKEEQDEVALWWRPHPLIETTIKSMRPALWEQYKEIVDNYKNGNWGIFDDTADLDRAIICTDAYYGDGSSLVQLYQKTGKPVMILNADV